jgi:hypothetical protein
MENTSNTECFSDPDPTSALIMSIWFTFLGVLGIPLNIFIVISTISVKEIRAIPANIFIGNLALSDSCLLLCFSFHLLYALIPSELTCKILGGVFSLVCLVNLCIPPFLAMNRYAIVCSEQENLARVLYTAFSRKGIYLMVLLIWIYQIVFSLPFTIFNTLGLHSLGVCGMLNIESYHRRNIHIYYIFGCLLLYFCVYTILLFFYSKVAAWVKSMSGNLTVTVQTRQTLSETKSVLRLTKWITIVPLIVTSPTAIAAALLEINPQLIPLRFARCFMCFYALSPVFNAFLTLSCLRLYHSAMKKFSKKTRLTSFLFVWMIERRIGVESENPN